MKKGGQHTDVWWQDGPSTSYMCPHHPQGMLKHVALSGKGKSGQKVREITATCQACVVYCGCCLTPSPEHVLLLCPLCLVHLHEAHVKGRRSGHKPSSWGGDVAVTNFLTPRSSECSAFRAGSLMDTGSLPLLSVLSLSTKAMLSNERKIKVKPRARGKESY